MKFEDSYLKIAILGKGEKIGSWIQEGVMRSFFSNHGELTRALLYKDFDAILVQKDIAAPEITASILLNHYSKKPLGEFPIVILAQSSTPDAHKWIRLLEKRKKECELPWVLALGKNVIYTSKSKRRAYFGQEVDDA